MRVLVEQTEAEVRGALERLGLLWDGTSKHAGQVGVHLLMGGADGGDWHLHPEHCSVLIGTQDMLLSRALNRGYGAARGRWPVDFGLLHSDCLWVLDEVQLMDIGLATSGQLQAFRNQSCPEGSRPSRSWWMSATLQRTWLETSPETRALAGLLPQTSIPAAERKGKLWDDVSKPLRLEPVKDASTIARLVIDKHLALGSDRAGPTLVVVNTVDTAIAVHRILSANRELRETEIRLVHSRFRPEERADWRNEFLNRKACEPGVDRIIVATQVIEAGVDLSAALLITELAPWASLVQRFGRAARWGGCAQLVVVDTEPAEEKAAAPYSKATLDAARSALEELNAAAPLDLERFEEEHSELLEALYPYSPRHLLLPHELEELFDTTPDLSGADIDVSRFIRSGEERDLQVFWWTVPKDATPDRKLRPPRTALCSVPFLKARTWLCGKESKSSRAPRLKAGMRAWVWDWLDGTWRAAERRDLYPGQTVLVAAECGGYDTVSGWNPDSKVPVAPVAPVVASPEELADAAQDDENLSAYPWQTIAYHGAAVGNVVEALAAQLAPELKGILELAGRWHDLGKAHPAFQASILGADRPSRLDLAKAPQDSWLPPRKLYPDPERKGTRRAGFRHELASTLALFSLLLRHDPKHPALLGPWLQFFADLGLPPPEPTAPLPPNALEQEVLALDVEQFDLLAYLVCSHHGKVRVTWHASPADQEAEDSALRIRGIRDGEVLPATLLLASDGQCVELPPSTLDLAPANAGLSPTTGRGWTERVLGMLKRHGPFWLAYLEALLRAADARASRRSFEDPLLGDTR